MSEPVLGGIIQNILNDSILSVIEGLFPIFWGFICVYIIVLIFNSLKRNVLRGILEGFGFNKKEAKKKIDFLFNFHDMISDVFVGKK